MRKDIFIDSSVAYKFASVKSDSEFFELVKWISNNTGDSGQRAYLMMSEYLRNEYLHQDSQKEYSIAHLYTELQAQERLIFVKKDTIKEFQNKHFKWCDISCKRTGSNDPEHIVLVLLSERKLALVEDEKLHYDLINFKKYRGKVKVINTCKDFDFINYQPAL